MSDTYTTLAPWSVARIAELVEASTKSIAIEVLALGADAAVRPAPDAWCASEVVGHVIEADRHGFAERVRAILASDRPILATWDQAAVAAARGDQSRDPAALVAELDEGRAADLELVRRLDAGDLARTGIHPEVGVLSVGDILHEWVHHDRAHLGQVLAITQALAWPRMGAARRFSVPDA